MEGHSANTCSDENALIAPLIATPSLASQEHNIQITQRELPHKNCLIHKVPQHLRLNNNGKDKEEDCYTPKFVSFGPYHYGSPQLSMTESFKLLAVQTLLSRSEFTWDVLYSEMFSIIDQVRNCYVGLPEGEDKIDGELLTKIMLLDSCFFIYVMKMESSTSEEGIFLEWKCYQYLGMSASSYIGQDMYLLENQIPLWVIQHLLSLIYREEGSRLLSDFLSKNGDWKWESMTKQPIHVLDARRMQLVPNEDQKTKGGHTQMPPETNQKKVKPKEGQTDCGRENDQTKFGKLNSQFRSVTDLKAKGIFFKPSSDSLKDIHFKSYGVFAVLRLPCYLFTNNSKRNFMNMVAYELSPEIFVGVDIILYLNFLKSLVLKPQDVRELREKKILFSSLDSDEQVLQVIKEIDTSGVHFPSVFKDVKDRIEKHCSSKLRTWIAEFVNTYFRSPWSFIALIAITLQLCLSIVSTYYAVHSAS